MTGEVEHPIELAALMAVTDEKLEATKTEATKLTGRVDTLLLEATKKPIRTVH